MRAARGGENIDMKTRMRSFGFGAAAILFTLPLAYWTLSFLFGGTGAADGPPAYFDLYAAGFLIPSLTCLSALATLGAGAFVPAVREPAKGLSLFVLGAGFLCAVASRLALSRLDEIYTLMGYWTGAACVVLSCAVIASLALSPPKADAAPSRAFRFVHFAVAVHVAVAVLSLQWEAIKLGWFAELSSMAIWTEIAAGLTLLAFLNRRRPLSPFATAGAAASAFAFMGMLAQAPAVYAIPVPYGLGWRLSASGWYAALAVSIPLLAFSVIFLRRSPRLGGFARYPRAAAAVVLAGVVCAGAVQTFSAQPRRELSREMSAAISDGGDEILLSELTDFEWDALEIHTGISLNNRPALGYGGINLLDRLTHGGEEESGMFLFVKDGKPVYSEALPSKVAYVEYLYNVRDSPRPDFINPIVLKREDAAFALVYHIDGFPPTLTVKDAAALMR